MYTANRRNKLVEIDEKTLLIPENLKQKLLLNDILTEKIAQIINGAEERNRVVKLAGRDTYSAYLSFGNETIYVEYTPVESAFFIHDAYQVRGNRHNRDSRR